MDKDRKRIIITTIAAVVVALGILASVYALSQSPRSGDGRQIEESTQKESNSPSQDEILDAEQD